MLPTFGALGAAPGEALVDEDEGAPVSAVPDAAAQRLVQRAVRLDLVPVATT